MTGMASPNYAEQIHQVIGPLIPQGSPLALFDFPSFCNVGDNAIWLGESEYLTSRHPASPIVWVADNSSASSGELPKLVADCVILIHGGGNFGDLWPHHQVLHERIVGHYRDHRIIQFPQSIHFENPCHADRCREVLSTHPDFHSRARAQRHRRPPDPAWSGIWAGLNIVRQEITEADHTFSTADWRSQVEQATTNWLDQAVL